MPIQSGFGEQWFAYQFPHGAAAYRDTGTIGKPRGSSYGKGNGRFGILKETMNLMSLRNLAFCKEARGCPSLIHLLKGRTTRQKADLIAALAENCQRIIGVPPETCG